MRIEVDQSGKIGDTRVPTVLAFSNGKCYTIFIPATVKRECIQQLRASRKLETRLYIQLFAVCIYLLLKKDINKIPQITIDLEYPGHEAKIKEHVINLLHRSGIHAPAEKIQFDYVGKRSNAHTLALSTFTGRTKPNKTIRTDDILREFKKQNRSGTP